MTTYDFKKLGKEMNRPSKELETFPTPANVTLVTFTSDELTSFCPVTGQPDFNTVTIEFQPDQLCLESKSLKLYLQAFRDQGVFYEDVVNLILDDLVRATRPRRMTVEGSFTVRGGISSVVTATHEAPPRRRAKRG